MQGLIVSVARSPRLQTRRLTQLDIDLATGKLEMPGDAIDAEATNYDDSDWPYDDPLDDLDRGWGGDDSVYAGEVRDNDYYDWLLDEDDREQDDLCKPLPGEIIDPWQHGADDSLPD